VVLSGTLTTPVDDQLKMAVVLLSGSGPDDRDYLNQFGHKPFLVLAHYLTEQGITVLRYDERGVGKSQGNYREASYERLASDAAAAVGYLRDKGYQKVGIIGHSEGGGLAPLASTKAKTDFLVLMAPDNSAADESIIGQTRTRLKDMDVDEHTSSQVIATIDSMLLILKLTSDRDIARKDMESLLLERDREATDDYKRVAKQLGDPHTFINGLLDPKFVYRLNHDPKETFKKMRMPVLVLFGDDDHLFDLKTNLPLIEHAFDSTDHDVKVFPGLGHLFMKTKGIPFESISEIEQTIDPEVLRTISKWIKQR
jgi:pimeloyl-ACP methyl ester carboxylesterase